MYDQFDEGILLIRENQVIYSNQRISKFIDNDLLLADQELLKLFSENEYSNLLQAISDIKPNENRNFSYKNQPVSIDFEINIKCFDYDNSKHILLIFN